MKKSIAVLWAGIVLSVIFYSAPVLFAVSARPGLETIEQPDGTKFRAQRKGDEWFNWTETENRLPVMHNKKTGYFEYAQVRRGQLALSGQIVGKRTPLRIMAASSPDFQAMAQEVRESRVQEFSAPEQSYSRTSQEAPTRAPMIGTQKVLVFLVNFKNRSLTYPESEWATKFFGDNLSVKHYYREISYGQLNMEPAEESSGTPNNGVVTVTLNTNHPDNGGDIDDRNQQMVKDAVLAADPYVNFAAFDTNKDGVISETELHIVLIPAGYEAAYSSDSPSVWAHKWTIFSVTPPNVDGKEVGGYPAGGYTMFGEIQGNHSATIGVMIHEMGHDLGLPDLYDGWSSSSGVSEWDVMANGSWSGGTYAGDLPTHMSAWSKYFLGWATPYKISHSSFTVPLAQAEKGTGKDFRMKQLLSNPGGAEMSGSGEYFLIENRQKTGYDTYLPGSGILVWHINESRYSNVSTNDKLVKLVPADNQIGWSNDGDTFPGSTGNRTFSDTTSPNSKLYNGNNSNVKISNISNSGEIMTANFTPPQPKLSLSASALTFTIENGSLNPSSKTFTISNTGKTDSTLYWEASADVPWISLSASQGTVENGSQTTVTVSVNSSGANTGSQGAITVKDPYTLDFGEIITVAVNGNDITPAAGLPTTPSDDGVYANSTKLTFRWGVGTLSDPESGIASYYLQVGTTPEGSDFYSGDVGNVTEKSLSGASDGKTYYARVRAKNGAGLFGTYSAVSNGILVDTTAPGRPLAATAITHPVPTKSYSEPKPEFSISGPEDASGISGYYWKIDNSQETVPTTKDNFTNQTSVAVTSPMEDGTWYFHAVAKDGAGNMGTLSYHQQFIIKTRIDVAQENTFESGEGVKVEIPHGTLSNSTQISIEKKTSAPTVTDSRIKETKIYQEIKLADGTRTFSKDVTVTIPYTDSDVVGLIEKDLRLFYYNEDQSKWVLIENSSVDTANKKVIGKVNHFTLFSAMQYSGTISNTILIYPNPYRTSQSSHLSNGIIISGAPANCDLKIFTVAGDLVKQLKDEDGDGTIVWNAKNENGETVASGVYFAHLSDRGSTKLLKLAIQH